MRSRRYPPSVDDPPDQTLGESRQALSDHLVDATGLGMRLPENLGPLSGGLLEQGSSHGEALRIGLRSCLGTN
jgi:hypothetical protein